MRYLFVLNLAVAILAASMAIGVGVSALLLGWYLDVAPEQRDSMISLLVLTVAYSAAAFAAGLAAWGMRRKARWHWLAQAAFVLTTVLSYFLSIQVLKGQ